MFNLNTILRKIPASLFLCMLVTLGIWLIFGSARDVVGIFQTLLGDEEVKRLLF